MKSESAKIGIGWPNSKKIGIGLESCNRCISNYLQLMKPITDIWNRYAYTVKMKNLDFGMLQTPTQNFV